MQDKDSTFGVEPQHLDRLIALGLEDRVVEAASPEIPPEGPGSRVGRYHLLEVLGEGGMGVVYLAEQTEPIQRQVALKIIKLGMDTRQVIARFEAERQALALMDHPNIARVLDAGATETGRPYFVMELVTGVSITEYCDRNSLSTKDRLVLFLQVCHAVQHAHQKGIIHRDLKPSNVLVTRVDDVPVPKIIDFGIAKATDQWLTEKTLFTRYGYIVGTPVYMSPEQADLTDLDIDTRSDVYSLGVLLYELLTGTTPFSQAELRQAGYLETQRVIREQVPAKPSTKLSTLGDTLTEIAKCRGTTGDVLRKAIRGDLDWIVMKSLEKDRIRRYETTASLAEDIRRHLEHEPVLARGPTCVYRLGKLLRRHRSQVLVTLVLTVIAMAAIIVLSLWHRDRRQLTEVESIRHRTALSQARGQYAKGEHQAALGTVTPILSSTHVGPEAQLLYASILVQGRLPDEATALLRALLGERREIAGAAHALLARILWESQSSSAENLEEIEEHRRQAAALLPEIAEAHFLRAMTAVTIAEQLAFLDRALELDPGHFESRRLRAFIYYASRKYERMEHEAFAMTIVQPMEPLGYSLRALAWCQLGRYPEALAEYDRALALPLATDPRYADLHGRRCEVLLRMGQYERVVVDARERLKNAPDATVLQSQVFCALTGLGRYMEARALMQSIAESSDDHGNEVWVQSMKYAFDTLAAGGRWHPADRPPEGPAFFYMLETEEMYRGLCAKARRLITDCFAPCWSPDGTQVAFASGLPGYSGVAVYDLKSHETNLLIVPGKDPSWSPDGRHIAFVRDAQVLRLSELTTGSLRRRTPAYMMGHEVWVMKADGSEPRRLARRADSPSWSADARRVYYRRREDLMLCSVSIADPQAQPVPVYAPYADHVALSPAGNYSAEVYGDNERAAVLGILDVAKGSWIAEWDTPLELGAGLWSPDGCEFSLGGFHGIRARTGLWIYDLRRKEGVKVLNGHFSGASWSLDRTRLLIRLAEPYWETWVADLDPNLSTAESLKPFQTLEEHCLQAIVTCTRDLEAAPDSFVDQWTRTTAALWIKHARAPDFLRELDLRLGRLPFRPAPDNLWAARDILGHAGRRERLGPLAVILARRAVEQQASCAEELATAFERLGQPEQAFRLRQIAGTSPPEGSYRYEKESNTYTVIGCGADIGSTMDEFHFVYKELRGGGSIIARIESIEDIHPESKAGVMFRESLEPNARFAGVFAMPDGGVRFCARPITGGSATADEHTATPGQTALRAPVWVKLERQGDQFSASYSSNGAAWTTAAWSPKKVPLSRGVLVGLAVTSHDNKKAAAARISHVAISGAVINTIPFEDCQDIRPPPPAAPGS